jgi:hypothetical protein
MSDSSNLLKGESRYILTMRTTILTGALLCAACATVFVQQSPDTSDRLNTQVPGLSRPCFGESNPAAADQVSAVPVAPATIGQIAWLSGNWEGGTGTRAVEERWSPASGGTMLAISRTVRGDVMIEFEFLCIAERKGTLVYAAMPNARAATEFTLTRIDATSATFENPAHDFPQVIRYVNQLDGTMEVVISGAGNSQPRTFLFRRSQ